MKEHLTIRRAPFDVSDEEIRGYMDFNEVLKKHRETPAPKPWKKPAILAVGIVIVLAVLMFMVSETDTEGEINGDSVPETESEVSTRKENGAEDMITDSLANRAGSNTETDTDDHASDGSGPDQYDKAEPAASSPDNFERETTFPVQTPPSDQPDPVSVEEADSPAVRTDTAAGELIFLKAEPEGGLGKLYEFFDKNLTYPESAGESGTEGKMVVTFTVFKDGSTGSYILENSLGSAFDKEALRILRLMPDWSPATVNGQPVDSKISIPLYFNKQ